MTENTFLLLHNLQVISDFGLFYCDYSGVTLPGVRVSFRVGGSISDAKSTEGKKKNKTLSQDKELDLFQAKWVVLLLHSRQAVKTAVVVLEARAEAPGGPRSEALPTANGTTLNWGREVVKHT